MAIWELVFYRDDEERTLSLSERQPWDVVAATGLGLAPIRRLAQRGPLQDGETDLGYRLDARLINLVLVGAAASQADMDAARDALAEFVGPRKSRPLALRVTRDDGIRRQIDCHVAGSIDFPVTEEERYGPRQKLALQLMAAEPTWYSPEYVQKTFRLIDLVAGLKVPVAVPVKLEAVNGNGNSFAMAESPSGDGRFSIVYEGSYEAFPLVKITGPVTSALIENETTGDVLSFSGYTLPAGETILIDLAYGRKTVVSGSGTNRIDKLSDDSDLATWRLVSKLEAPGGSNKIRFSGTSLTAASHVDFTFRNRYISL